MNKKLSADKLSLNKAYEQRKQSDWEKYNQDDLPYNTQKNTVLIKYNESFKKVLPIDKWKHISKYQRESGLRDVAPRLRVYSHLLITDKHTNRVYHYIALYFNQPPPRETISLVTAPLKHKLSKDPEIKLINESKTPQPCLDDRFNFHIDGKGVFEFVKQGASFSASDFEDNETETEKNAVANSSRTNRNKSSSEGEKRVEENLSVDDSAEDEEYFEYDDEDEEKEDELYKPNPSTNKRVGKRQEPSESGQIEDEGDCEFELVLTFKDKVGSETYYTNDIREFPNAYKSILQMKTAKRLKKYAEIVKHEVKDNKSFKELFDKYLK